MKKPLFILSSLIFTCICGWYLIPEETKNRWALVGFSNRYYSTNQTNSEMKITLGDYVDHNSILYLAESTNMLPIPDDSLKYFLTAKEMENAFDSLWDESEQRFFRNINYYDIGKNKREGYDIITLFIENTAAYGRDYHFHLRTFNTQHEMIDDIPFAYWDRDDNLYFEGELTTDNLILIRTKEEIIAKYKLNNGKFIKE